MQRTDFPGWREVVAGVVRTSGALLREHGGGLILLFAGLLLPLWGFAELADEVHDGEVFPFDEPILRYAQALARDGFDQVFLLFSALGFMWGVIPVDLALIVGLALARHYRRCVFAAVALLGSAALNLATKQFFARDRPSLWESIAPEATYSFPSGHAMGSMTLGAVLVMLTWHGRWRWPMFAAMLVFVPMVGLSRVYLGVHYPSDILAGWAAASVWAVGCYLLVFGPPGVRQWRERRGQSGMS